MQGGTPAVFTETATAAGRIQCAEPLQLPSSRSQQYNNFILTMPEQLDLCPDQQARSLLSKASIREPVTWEPPPGWVTGWTTISRCSGISTT